MKKFTALQGGSPHPISRLVIACCLLPDDFARILDHKAFLLPALGVGISVCGADITAGNLTAGGFQSIAYKDCIVLYHVQKVTGLLDDKFVCMVFNDDVTVPSRIAPLELYFDSNDHDGVVNRLYGELPFIRNFKAYSPPDKSSTRELCNLFMFHDKGNPIIHAINELNPVTGANG